MVTHMAKQAKDRALAAGATKKEAEEAADRASTTAIATAGITTPMTY
jgi:hypothetical protein